MINVKYEIKNSCARRKIKFRTSNNLSRFQKKKCIKTMRFINFS